MFVAFSKGLSGVLLHSFRRRLLRWTVREYGRTIRVVVVVCAFVLAWPFVAADFNLYLNQEHLRDRVIALASFGLL